MQHVFTMEQEEYRIENITWDHIHYTDNRPTLDLLALKPMSVISLLDEESRFPQVPARAGSGGGGACSAPAQALRACSEGLHPPLPTPTLGGSSWDLSTHTGGVWIVPGHRPDHAAEAD